MEIEDGRRGVFDVAPYLDFGVFRELRDVNYFNQVGVLFGAVTWSNEQDIAPETLLEGMVPLVGGENGHHLDVPGDGGGNGPEMLECKT